MRVIDIELQNYRNIEKAKLKLSPNVNVFYGRNAQGKTNLLEALYLFSQGKSFRGGKDKEFILFGKENATIKMNYFSENRDISFLLTFFSDGKKKLAKVGGMEIKRNMDIVGHFYTVLFAPEHLNLVKEGPSSRRAFLDTAISALKPKYAKAIADYEKIITHKNALLKDIYRYPTLMDTLSVWNEKQATIGSYIVFMRNSYIKNLAEIAINNHKELSKGKEDLSLKYITFTADEEILSDLAKCKEALKNEIDLITDDELQAGISLIGPTRDDVDILINSKSARLFGSQGQQRSAVLSIKLAEGDLVYKTTGEQPVMLLDDVMSELDRLRQSYILKKIVDRQVIITGCDRGNFRKCDNVSFFTVKEGVIERS